MGRRVAGQKFQSGNVLTGTVKYQDLLCTEAEKGAAENKKATALIE